MTLSLIDGRERKLMVQFTDFFILQSAELKIINEPAASGSSFKRLDCGEQGIPYRRKRRGIAKVKIREILNPHFRGNCDGRLFKNLVLRYGAKCVADPMLGSGTTRDVIAGLNRHQNAGIKYWGGDLRSGFDLTRMELPGRYDLVWLHPPYWNIIEYRAGPGDLSSCRDYGEFRALFMLCLKRCYDALVAGGRLAVLIGNVRRAGQYTPIIRDTLNFPHGQIRSIIIKVQHNCTSDRKTYGRLEDSPIKHEYCVVFRKPHDAQA
jgi:hypothetical protein